MIVEIENIGLFEHAEAQVNGLTVIAGVNDTGKSTLGKVVFSVIHGLKSYKHEQEEHKEEQVSSIVNELFFLLRRITVDVSNKSYIEKMFFPPAFIKEIKEDPIKSVKLRINIVESLDVKDRLVFLANKNLDKLLSLVSKNESEIELMRSSINRALISEFQGQISSKFNDRPSKIKFKSNQGITLVEIDVVNDSVTSLYVKDELLYSDVIFIDSPIVMQLSHLIKGCSTSFNSFSNRTTVPLHWKDLNRKLIASKYKFDYLDDDQFFGSLIGGQIEYDEDIESFNYGRVVDNHKFDVRAINVASGIKSLSIINLLISSGQISVGSFLIIDEPEVNLHPEWQVEYAKAIALLASLGVTIIVTTHSPYMIEALKTFDKIDELDADFLLTSKAKSGVSTLNNYKNNVSSIIGSLSKPLDMLHDMHVQRVFDDF